MAEINQSWGVFENTQTAPTVGIGSRGFAMGYSGR
jgi:hypothetical protein